MTRSTDTPYPLPFEPGEAGGSHLVSYVAEEFYALPEADSREELYRGQIIREPLPSFGHGALAVRIASLLDAWVRPRGLGQVVDHSGFVLARNPDTVRGPDVAFVSRDRLEEGTAAGPFFEGAPDLAVEVRSPSDGTGELGAKAREYLRAGAQEVWIVDPERREITVHRSGEEPRHLGSSDTLDGDTLDGGHVLPGFTVAVESLLE